MKQPWLRKLVGHVIDRKTERQRVALEGWKCRKLLVVEGKKKKKEKKKYSQMDDQRRTNVLFYLSFSPPS